MVQYLGHPEDQRHVTAPPMRLQKRHELTSQRNEAAITRHDDIHGAESRARDPGRDQRAAPADPRSAGRLAADADTDRPCADLLPGWARGGAQDSRGGRRAADARGVREVRDLFQHRDRRCGGSDRRPRSDRQERPGRGDALGQRPTTSASAPTLADELRPTAPPSPTSSLSRSSRDDGGRASWATGRQGQGRKRAMARTTSRSKLLKLPEPLRIRAKSWRQAAGGWARVAARTDDAGEWRIVLLEVRRAVLGRLVNGELECLTPNPSVSSASASRAGHASGRDLRRAP